MSISFRTTVLLLITALLMVMAGFFTAPVEAYPEREVRMIVPFSAGGSIDRMARRLADYWGEELGVPFVVENRTGAGGLIGFTYFMERPADGHTILVGVDPYLSIAILREAGFTMEDFAFINVQQFDPSGIIVREDSPYQTIDDLIDAIKENPGELSVGTVTGGALQIVIRQFTDELGLSVREVYYDGGGPTELALLGGEVDFVTNSITSYLRVQDEARHLGVAANSRHPIASHIPTLNEVLEPYGVTIAESGSTRFIAVHQAFKEQYPEHFNLLIETYKNIIQLDEFREDMDVFYGPEESQRLMEGLFSTTKRFESLILGQE